MTDLDGARVLLTGATGGLGQAMARHLRRAGADLVLTGRNEEVLRPLADELAATAVVTDLAEPDAVPHLLDAAGEVDVLVANAALPGTGLLQEMPVERVQANVEVNLRAPLLLTHALLPRLLDQGRGHLVYIGSLSGVVASPGSALYNTTKFALRGLAGGLRQDLHGTGVVVSLVEPGFVRDAGMFARSGMTLPPGVRTTTPDHVARAVVRAIHRNEGEVMVAPPEMRLATRLGMVAPGLSATIQRKVGAADIVSKHQG